MIVIEKVNKNDDCNAEKYDEYWIEQNKCPQCHTTLKIYNEPIETWGFKTTYKIHECPNGCYSRRM